MQPTYQNIQPESNQYPIGASLVKVYIHTYIHAQVSTIVDGSQLSEVHLELLDESSDRKKSRRSCDDDNAGIALRKSYQTTFRDEDDDDGETSVSIAIANPVL